MSLRFLTTMFAGLVLATAVEAAERQWVGAQLHFPVPSRDVGDTELGIDAGVTFTAMKNEFVGLGADVIYHYWPASEGYEAAFDRFLRSTRFESLAGPWAFTALQVTGHVKLALPSSRRVTPWVQIGAGGYRLDRNLDERRPADTYARVLGPTSRNISVVPGGYGAIGLDVHVSPRVRLGMDAACHYVGSRDEAEFFMATLPDFTAVTAGMHVRFGWE